MNVSWKTNQKAITIKRSSPMWQRPLLFPSFPNLLSSFSIQRVWRYIQAALLTSVMPNFAVMLSRLARFFCFTPCTLGYGNFIETAGEKYVFRLFKGMETLLLTFCCAVVICISFWNGIWGKHEKFASTLSILWCIFISAQVYEMWVKSYIEKDFGLVKVSIFVPISMSNLRHSVNSERDYVFLSQARHAH